jgi:hypothetical protein|mmetsp:Transcript_5394/g.8399  ORF Transcript_5394/g.8399 Transcript_5394/m.8399 type:complete len:109 (+) Transcript_5394:584-910(+)
MRGVRAYTFSVLAVPVETLGAARRALETHRAACAAANPESARGLDVGVVVAAGLFAAVANYIAAHSVAAAAAATGTATAAMYRTIVRVVRALLATGVPPNGGARGMAG